MDRGCAVINRRTRLRPQLERVRRPTLTALSALVAKGARANKVSPGRRPTWPRSLLCSATTPKAIWQQERDAPHPFRRVGKPREHEVHDVLSHVVLTVRDEDLLAVETIAAVAGWLGARAGEAEIRARLRFGEIHRAGPAAFDQIRQVAPLRRLEERLKLRLLTSTTCSVMPPPAGERLLHASPRSGRD